MKSGLGRFWYSAVGVKLSPLPLNTARESQTRRVAFGMKKSEAATRCEETAGWRHGSGPPTLVRVNQYAAPR